LAINIGGEGAPGDICGLMVNAESMTVWLRLLLCMYHTNDQKDQRKPPKNTTDNQSAKVN
jgi:hypothetical protein